MRVLVTGIGGFVGHAVARRLLEDGHAVRGLLLPAEQTPLPEGVEPVRGDITDMPSLAGLFDGCDAVVHLAAVTGYGVSWGACHRVNVHGTRNVVEACLAAGVTHLVHMSSVSVYGRVPGVPLTEDAPHVSIGDPYGDTKIAAESVVREGERRGLAVTILRPTVLYGPGDRLFLPKLMENVRSQRARVIGRGEHAVDLLHVDDAADFVALVLGDPRARGQAYNLTHPDNPSWRELLAIVADELGLPAPTRRLPYPLALALAGALELRARATGSEPRLTRYAVRVIGRPYDYRTDKAQALGFAPRIGLEAGVRACVRDILGQEAARDAA